MPESAVKSAPPIGQDVMKALSDHVGKRVTVEHVLFGSLNTEAGTLLGMMDFLYLSVNVKGQNDKDRLMQYPFIGLNLAVRRVLADDDVLYDNTANVAEDLRVRTGERAHELSVKSFGAETVERVNAELRGTLKSAVQEKTEEPKTRLRRLFELVRDTLRA